MRTLNIPLDDKDFKRLERAKGALSWREFILKLVPDGC